MKNIIKNSLIIFAVTVLTISLFDGILVREWSLFNFFIEILFVSTIISLSKKLTDRLQSPYYILDIAIEFSITLTIVMGFGYVLHWYKIENARPMFYMVLFAYIICFFLDVLKTKKNIELINEKLKERKNCIGRVK